MNGASRRDTFRLLGMLQAGQYLPINFIYMALVVILRDRGASLSQIALVSSVGLLFSVKFLWAPLLDRFGGRRGHFRSWLLVLQPLMAAMLIALLPLDPVGDYGLVMVVVLIVVQASAMQDVAADALAVRALEPQDRGVGSGVRFAGGYVGHMLGGGAVLFVYSQWGWRAAVVSLAVLTAIPLWPLARYREPEYADIGERPGFRAVVTVFKVPGVVRWTLFLLPLSWIGVTGGYALVTPMLVDAGWSADRVGLIVGIAVSSVGGLAALGAGLLVKRLGRRRVLALSCGAQGLALLGFSPMALGHAPFLGTTVALCSFGAVYAAGSVAINAITMDFTRPATAASDFTVLASVGTFVSLVGGALAVALAGHVGYLAVLIVATMSVMAAAVVNARLKDPPVVMPQVVQDNVPVADA
ncbi:MFS transporter [Lentzea sp.]|uniref:MFS transporter n=1 Tax=Lentzea sp. TaxID=56099 RepID=UPI002D1136F6|nr:MFS transporter [Lentzea sp.]HUQ55225.1 MFS transporter [Lentzea sp.]